MTDLNPEQIAWLVESAESKAWMSYYVCAPLEFTLKYRVSVLCVGSAWITMMPGAASWFFNRINSLGLEGAASEATLDEAIAVVESAGCTEYTVQLSPRAQPAELGDWLQERGMRVRSNWAKMYRGNDPAPSPRTDVRIEQVAEESAAVFGGILLDTFEMPRVVLPMMACHLGKPGWINYLGFDGEKPVATASMFISDDVAWLGMGSTLASHRGRGAQSAMFARRIEDGLKAGCKWFVTETGEDTPEQPNPSYHNMLRAGFKLAYMRPNYVNRAE